MGGSLTNSKPRLVLPMTRDFNHIIHCLHALVDSGSEQNLIDTELAKQLKLLFVPLDPPILTLHSIIRFLH